MQLYWQPLRDLALGSPTPIRDPCLPQSAIHDRAASPARHAAGVVLYSLYALYRDTGALD